MDEKDPYVPDYKTDKEKLLALITCLLPPALTNYEWSTLPSKREMYWNTLMRDGTIKLQPYTWNVLRETFEVLWNQYEYECLYLCDSCLHDKTAAKELPFYKTGHEWCVALLKILNKIKGRHRDRTIFIPPAFISQMVKLRKQLEKEDF